MAKELWTIRRKCYPQFDEDMCLEWEMEYFENRADAIRFAKECEDNYADRDWDGHRYYKSKFYADTITQEEIRENERRWARQMANSM